MMRCVTVGMVGSDNRFKFADMLGSDVRGLGSLTCELVGRQYLAASTRDTDLQRNGVSQTRVLDNVEVGGGRGIDGGQ
eukprot:3938107-Rhodomonas_salina.1